VSRGTELKTRKERHRETDTNKETKNEEGKEEKDGKDHQQQCRW
jgi:hypothetical protein